MSLTIESTTSPESATIIRDFLKSRSSGVLATSDSASQPHAAAIYFSLEDDFSIVFATKSETQKYKNMAENPQAAFVVYDEQQQTTVQITGHVEALNDPDKLQTIVNHMFLTSAEQSKREIPPADKLYAGDYRGFRLVPMVIKMAVYARPDSEGDDLYETLLFSGS